MSLLLLILFQISESCAHPGAPATVEVSSCTDELETLDSDVRLRRVDGLLRGLAMITDSFETERRNFDQIFVLQEELAQWGVSVSQGLDGEGRIASVRGEFGIADALVRAIRRGELPRLLAAWKVERVAYALEHAFETEYLEISFSKDRVLIEPRRLIKANHPFRPYGEIHWGTEIQYPADHAANWIDSRLRMAQLYTYTQNQND